MNSSEYEELKQDVREIKNQLSQIVELLQILVEKKNGNNSQLENNSISKEDNETNNNNNIRKYVIKRKNKDKRRRYYDTRDLVASHTIIKKEVLKDLEERGFSMVRRYENEEETEPVNDPIHVNICYNFGFVLDVNSNKHNAVILVTTACSHNVIHINVVRKLKLDIKMVNRPFVVTSSMNKFVSKRYVILTFAVKVDNTTNRMMTSKFVVTDNDHYNDMISVEVSTLECYAFSKDTIYRFKDIVNELYVF